MLIFAAIAVSFWTVVLDEGASAGLAVATVLLTLAVLLGIAETLEAIRRRRRVSAGGLHRSAQRSRTPVEDLGESSLLEGALTVYAVSVLPLLEAGEDIGEMLMGLLSRVGRRRVSRQLSSMSQVLEESLQPGEQLREVATAAMYKPGWRILNVWRPKGVVVAVTNRRLLCFRTKKRGKVVAGDRPVIRDPIDAVYVLEWYKGIGTDRFNYVLVVQDSSGVKHRFDFAPALWTTARGVYEALTTSRSGGAATGLGG